MGTTLFGLFFLFFYYSRSISRSLQDCLLFYAFAALSDLYVALPMIIAEQSLLTEFQNFSFVVVIFLTKFITVVFVLTYLRVYERKETVSYPIPAVLNLIFFLFITILLAGEVSLLFGSIFFENASRLEVGLGISLALAFPLLLFLYINLQYFYSRAQVLLAASIQNKSLGNRIQLLLRQRERERRFYHDQKAHLAQMKSFLESGNFSDLEAYLETYTERMDESYSLCCYGHPVLDSLLGQFDQRCNEKGIQLDVFVHIEEKIVFDNFDLTILLANLFDNAYFGVPAQRPTKGVVKVSIVAQKGTFFIYVENPIEPGKENFKFGIGLKNVEEVVKKYHGRLEIDTKSRVFSVSALLYQPS